MSKCVKCGSYAFNLYKEDIDQGGLCDVHYWQYRAHRAEALAEQPARPYRLLQDNGSKYFGESWDKAEQPAQQEQEPICKLFGTLPVYDRAAQQEPVAFLASGTRFKISYDNRQSGGQIHGIPPELGGRWVAFVAADDDCHLKLTSPPAQRIWVWLTDEEKAELDAEHGDDTLAHLDAIEAKLREKNA